MKVLIDTDIYIYKVAAKMQPVFYWVGENWFDKKVDAIKFCNDNEVDVDLIVKQECMLEPWRVKYEVENALEGIESKVKKHIGKADIIYTLSGKDNYRKGVTETYKANRPPKPFYAQMIKEEFISQVDPIIVNHLEADDVMAMGAEMNPKGTVILSIDKDLLNIPTNHFNPDTCKLTKTTAEKGCRSFLKQVITGDTVDNIKGVKGLGISAATKIVDSMEELTWDCFMSSLDTFLKDKDKTYNKESILTDVILLDIGIYWSRRLGLEVDESIKKYQREGWCELVKRLK